MNRLEQIILKNLIYNEAFTRKVIPFIRSDYFSDDAERIVFKEVFDFTNKYKNLPTHEALVINLTESKSLTEPQVKSAIELLNDIKESKDETVELAWITEQTEKFCQDKAIYNAIMESVHILDDKQTKRSKGEIPKLLSDALGVSFDSNVGHDYMQDFDDRYDFYHRVESRVRFDLVFVPVVFMKIGCRDKQEAEFNFVKNFISINSGVSVISRDIDSSYRL